MSENARVAAESLLEVLARVEHRFDRAERAFRTLLVSRRDARLDALEDVLVHGRAVTNVMQKFRYMLPEFESWYAPHVAKLRADPGMKRFYEMRSEVLKEGRLSVTQAATLFDVGPPWHPDPPEGAVAFIPYDDETGKCGWVVRRPDGVEERLLTEQPLGVQVTEFLAFNPSLGTMDDLQVEMTANRYVSYLRNMLDELRVLVLRAS
jgi:hypothetical protein